MLPAGRSGWPTEETLQSIACAHSLSGDLESACASLRRLLTEVSPDRRRAKVAELKDDKDLKSVKKADCFKALLRELGLD